MGSGRSGLYSGTIGSSQPFAFSYGVTPNMKDYDRARGILNDDGGYDKNPTARNLEDMINGNYIGNKHVNGVFTYAVTLGGDIIVGKRNGNGSYGKPTPHPTLIGGKNPKVRVAGILEIRGGKIFSYDDRSGHFKPNRKSLQVADDAFGKLPDVLFHKNSSRRKDV